MIIISVLPLLYALAYVSQKMDDFDVIFSGCEERHNILTNSNPTVQIYHSTYIESANFGALNIAYAKGYNK